MNSGILARRAHFSGSDHCKKRRDACKVLKGPEGPMSKRMVEGVESDSIANVPVARIDSEAMTGVYKVLSNDLADTNPMGGNLEREKKKKKKKKR